MAIVANVNSPPCRFSQICIELGSSVAIPKYQRKICTSIGTFWWYSTHAADDAC